MQHHWHQEFLPVQHLHKYCIFACIMYCRFHTALCIIFCWPSMIKWCRFFVPITYAVVVIIHTPRFQATVSCVDITVFGRCAKLSLLLFCSWAICAQKWYSKRETKLGGMWKRQNVEIIALITSYNNQSFKWHMLCHQIISFSVFHHCLIIEVCK